MKDKSLPKFGYNHAAEKEADEFFDKVEVKTKKIAAPKIQWTQSPPTVDGYYWWRHKMEDKPMPVEYKRSADLCWCIGGLYGTAKGMGGWWLPAKPQGKEEPEWTQSPPTKAGAYWRWSGSKKEKPVYWYVDARPDTAASGLRVGTSWSSVVSTLGGWWTPVIVPAPPGKDGQE